MLDYISRRLLMMVPLLFGITIITFTVIHLAPGSPVDVQTEMPLKDSVQAREKLNRLYGLDKPLHIQYINWLKRIARLDFDRSFVDGRNVKDKIFESVRITIGIKVLSISLICAAYPT